MSTDYVKYVRTGKQLQYLHRSGCRRCPWWQVAVGNVYRWRWADTQPYARVARAAERLDLRLCRACQPLGVRPVRSPR